MSGSHWDYKQFEIGNTTKMVAYDKYVRESCPWFADMIEELGQELETIVHDLDYHISGDSALEPDFYKKSLLSLCEIANTYKHAVEEMERKNEENS